MITISIKCFVYVYKTIVSPNWNVKPIHTQPNLLIWASTPFFISKILFRIKGDTFHPIYLIKTHFNLINTNHENNN